MALQSSVSIYNPLYMSAVETELGLSGTIYLDQSQVRTLFGVPSGTIYLLDGLGKSATIRPSGATYTGTTPTNPTYAYDKTVSSVDTSTTTTLFTSSNITSTQIYSFASGTKSGTLHIYFDTINTADNMSSDLLNEAVSTVSLSIMTDGVSYNPKQTWTAGDTASGFDYTQTLSSQSLSNLKVEISTQSTRIGSGLSLAIAAVACNVSDIVIL